jgi:hypothetical protein
MAVQEKKVGTVEQVGRIHIRKQGGRWYVKRYVKGTVFFIYSADSFGGIRNYMDMRRRDW